MDTACKAARPKLPTHASLIKMSNIEKIKASMIDLLDIDGLAQLSIEGLNLLELV